MDLFLILSRPLGVPECRGLIQSWDVLLSTKDRGQFALAKKIGAACHPCDSLPFWLGSFEDQGLNMICVFPRFVVARTTPREDVVFVQRSCPCRSQKESLPLGIFP